MKLKTIARLVSVLIPLYFAFGFIRGCSKGGEDEFLKSAIKNLSIAKIENDRVTIEFWHARAPVNLWSVNYSVTNASNFRADYRLPEPLLIRIGGGSFELAFTVAYGELTEDPKTKQTRVVIRPFPAFLATCGGHAVGYFLGTSLGLAEDKTKIDGLARNEAFRKEVLDEFYDNLAVRLFRFLDSHPTLPGATDDRSLFVSFARTSEHTDQERAKFHFRMLSFFPRTAQHRASY
jgi:hypothetical protein